MRSSEAECQDGYNEWMVSYTTQEICDRVGGELEGREDLVIGGVDQLDRARSDQFSFIRDARYAAGWASSNAGAALVSREVALAPGLGRALIRVADADLALAVVLEMFAPPPVKRCRGIHSGATVDSSSRIDESAAIGPGCVIGQDVAIGKDTTLHANVTVMDQCSIGIGCELYPGVVICERCELGDRVILHPNVAIGADGFGYRAAPNDGRLVKIPHIGTVKIGNDVEIGAGTCVDRGKFSATTIGDGTKIDNLCQIAHNCQIGRSCAIAGQVGLAGSVTVGDRVTMGGKVAVRDNVTIGAGATLAATAAVMNDVPPGATWAGYPAQEALVALKEHAAMRKLPGLLKRLKSQVGNSNKMGAVTK